MEENEKHFKEWIVVKSDLHEKATVRDIKDGDMYWCVAFQGFTKKWGRCPTQIWML